MTNSLLDVIDKVDSYSYEPDHSNYTLYAHDGLTAIGLIRVDIAQHFGNSSGFSINHETKSVSIDSQYDTISKRDELFASIASQWRKYPEFEQLLDHGWRNELYTVYNPSSVPYLHLERAFSVLTGCITYGTHLCGYVPANKSSNGKLKIWIPRRSKTKSTFPGLLDNTVAGGLGYPYGIWETVVKESYEEAGLSGSFIESHTKAAGVLSYMYLTEDNRVQPEVEFLYDIEFDDEHTVVPIPVDGEAEDFQLLEVEDILVKIKNNEFKPNSALVVIDFLIRHGIITPESEKFYGQIVSRSHRRLPFPTL
ncbi:thiamine pyrophosphokinase [Scheffersomyces amazonensis]|uniref:thiamine pyrophosphokinase n=1 Tax=Scheffersomyces amazonensis TaxID=1078765 RepID=UPI00315D6D23